MNENEGKMDQNKVEMDENEGKMDQYNEGKVYQHQDKMDQNEGKIIHTYLWKTRFFSKERS